MTDQNGYPTPQAPLEPINVLMPKIAAAIGAIRKGRETTSGATYKFRGIDDVLDAIHEHLCEFGVTPYPRVVSVEREERESVDGTRTRYQSVVSLTLEVRFVGPLGDEQCAQAVAEAQDYGDKATTKAESVAYRTIMVQVFSIPVSETVGATADIEDDHSDRAAPSPTRVMQEQINALAARGPGFPASTDQLQQLGVLQSGMTDDERHMQLSELVNRPINSAKELTKREAALIIPMLRDAAKTP
jgi:hypothetical protein